MVIVFTLLAGALSLLALILTVIRNNRRDYLAIVPSTMGLICGFIALAVAAPRDVPNLGLDYLGIIVAILAALITMLVGMQLYNALKLKEDAREVSNAKEHIDHYSEKIDTLKQQTDSLSETIDNLNTKTIEIEEDIRPLYDSIMELQEKMKWAILKDPYDGPDDDK